MTEFASSPFLVPLDGSSAAEHALPWAKALAAAYGSRLILMHVVDDRDAGREAAGKARDVFVKYAGELARREGIALAEGTIETWQIGTGQQKSDRESRGAPEFLAPETWALCRC